MSTAGTEGLSGAALRRDRDGVGGGGGARSDLRRRDCYGKFSLRAELSHESRVDRARGEPERLAASSKQNAAPANEIQARGGGVTSQLLPVELLRRPPAGE